MFRKPSFQILTICLLFISTNINSQITITPNTITPGTCTTVTFSGGPINITNGTCIEVYLQQGTQILYASASSVYYQASNVLVTTFCLASNTLTGAYDIVFYDYCNSTVLATYTRKLTVAVSSIMESIRGFFDFDIFPNPIESGQNLKILSQKTMVQPNTIAVYNSVGKLVLSKTIQRDNEEVNTENLTKGTYFIQITNKDGNTLSKKLEVK